MTLSRVSVADIKINWVSDKHNAQRSRDILANSKDVSYDTAVWSWEVRPGLKYQYPTQAKPKALLKYEKDMMDPKMKELKPELSKQIALNKEVIAYRKKNDMIQSNNQSNLCELERCMLLFKRRGDKRKMQDMEDIYCSYPFTLTEDRVWKTTNGQSI